MADLTFPALPGWAEYDAAVQRYTELLTQRRTHAAVLEDLEGGEAEAIRADDEARAAALLAGDKDPGPKHHTKWKRDRDAARDHARVLATAITQAAQAVGDLLDAEPDQALQAATDAVEAARQEYDDRMDGLLEARDAFWRARAVIGWLNDGRTLGRAYKPAGAPPSLVDPRSMRPGAIRVSDPVNAERALAWFRAETDADPEPAQVAGYRVRRDVEVRGADDWTKGTRSAVDSITYRPVPIDAQGNPVERR